MSAEKPFFEQVDISDEFKKMYSDVFFIRNFFQKPDLFSDRSKDLEMRMTADLDPLDSDYGEIECYKKSELTGARCLSR